MRLFAWVFSCMLFVVLCSSSGCEQKPTTDVAATADTSPPPPPPPPPAPEPLAPPTPDPKPKNAKVKVTTRFGDMVIQLYDETPGHRDNFLMLASKGFYNDLLFHRVINGFMAQGGDPGSRNAAPNAALGAGSPGYTIPAEFNPAFVHKKGALCAARQGDFANPERKSSGSQFYIVQGKRLTDAEIDQMQQYVRRKTPNFTYTAQQREAYKTLGGTPQLDMDYTVYGEVIEGLAVIDSICKQPGSAQNRPFNDIKMTVKVIQ
jgi:cyclophilin family peptidyl-prolyl cis-trans isomerase